MTKRKKFVSSSVRGATIIHLVTPFGKRETTICGEVIKTEGLQPTKQTEINCADCIAMIEYCQNANLSNEPVNYYIKKIGVE